MSARCRYCNTTEVEWVEYPDKGWRLLNPNGTVHRCAEYHSVMSSVPAMPNRTKKTKHGSFLRLYGPTSGRTHAVLIHTRAAKPGTPEAMFDELESEPRDPVFTHRVR